MSRFTLRIRVIENIDIVCEAPTMEQAVEQPWHYAVSEELFGDRIDYEVLSVRQTLGHGDSETT